MDVTGSINTKDPLDTNREVRRIYENLFGSALFERVNYALEIIVDLFNGKYPGYQKCDTAYHDLEHSLQAYLATARMCDGHIKENQAACSREFVVIALISALAHDTGFIKETWDSEGSGAKYSLKHVDRSRLFLSKFLPKIGFSSLQIQYAKNIISCTGLQVDLSKIPFVLEEERISGYIVGTADFLGQMSDPDYLKKLPRLFNEFREGGVPGYNSVEDLIKKTPLFFEKFVMERLGNDFHSVYRFAASHFGGKDLYIEGIKRNIKKIEEYDCCQGELS